MRSNFRQTTAVPGQDSDTTLRDPSRRVCRWLRLRSGHFVAILGRTPFRQPRLGFARHKPRGIAIRFFRRAQPRNFQQIGGHQDLTSFKVVAQAALGVEIAIKWISSIRPLAPASSSASRAAASRSESRSSMLPLGKVHLPALVLTSRNSRRAPRRR